MDNHIYYIIFDPYSLLQVETHLYCQKLSKKYNIPITCCNAIELCPDEKKAPVSLRTCLKYLSKLPGRYIHVFVDEYDSEELTESKSLDIVRLLKTFFVKSYFILSTQSLVRNRRFIDENKEEYKKRTNCLDVLATCMERIDLTKVMRYTNAIKDVSQLIQLELQSNENICFPPLRQMPHTPALKTPPRYVEEEIHSSYSDNTSHQNDDNANDEASCDVIDSASNRARSHSFAHISFDRMMKNVANNKSVALDLFDKDLAMKTKFDFYNNDGCGHKVEGSVPSIVRRLNSAHINDVARAINELAAPMWNRCLYICGDLKLAESAYHALTALEIHVVEYLDGLEGQVSSFSRKEDVYNTWTNSNNGILLTDNRGCRGLQHEQVVILLDEDDRYERFLLPEMIGRSTSRLVILSFKSETERIPKEGGSNQTVGCILEHLLSKGLLTLYTNEDLPELPHLKQSNYCKKFRTQTLDVDLGRYINAWAKLYGSDEPIETSSLILFMRSRKLIKYIVDRNLEVREKMENFNGETLYVQCKQIAKDNEKVFNKIINSVFDGDAETYLGVYDQFLNAILGSECNMGRLIFVFTVCMVICKRLEQRKRNYLQGCFIDTTARIVVKNEDWVTKNDLTNFSEGEDTTSLKEFLQGSGFTSLLAVAMGGLAALFINSLHSR